MENCCFVTLTCWTEFLVSYFNINDIFYASVLFRMLFCFGFVTSIATVCS